MLFLVGGEKARFDLKFKFFALNKKTMRAIIKESKSTSILQLTSLNKSKIFGKVSIKEYFAKNKISSSKSRQG